MKREIFRDLTHVTNIASMITILFLMIYESVILVAKGVQPDPSLIFLFILSIYVEYSSNKRIKEFEKLDAENKKTKKSDHEN